jgi:hypothetical protein
LLSYLIVHFVAVLIYTWPKEETASKYYNYGFTYVYPYFHQSWALFIPVPKHNFHVYVKYKVRNEPVNWHDLFYDLNSAHQKNRFAGYESLLLALTNSLRYYASSVGEKTKLENPDNGNVNYTVLRKIIHNYLTHYEGADAKGMIIIIGIKSTETHKEYFHYYLN